VEADQLVIGLHPASAQNPAGRNGSITIGLTFSTPIEQAVSTGGLSTSINEDCGLFF